MKESNLLSSVEQCLSSVILEGENICNEQVEIEREVIPIFIILLLIPTV